MVKKNAILRIFYYGIFTVFLSFIAKNGLKFIVFCNKSKNNKNATHRPTFATISEIQSSPPTFAQLGFYRSNTISTTATKPTILRTLIMIIYVFSSIIRSVSQSSKCPATWCMLGTARLQFADMFIANDAII